LIRDYDGPTPETASELDANNPVVHLPITTENDSTTNPLAVELISMASVLNNLESSPEVCPVIIWPNLDPHYAAFAGNGLSSLQRPDTVSANVQPMGLPGPAVECICESKLFLAAHGVETQRSFRTQFYDGQPAIEVTENMLKFGAVESST
jgi:hypothetical protein